jgi:hypothetical protein
VISANDLAGADLDGGLEQEPNKKDKIATMSGRRSNRDGCIAGWKTRNGRSEAAERAYRMSRLGTDLLQLRRHQRHQLLDLLCFMPVADEQCVGRLDYDQVVHAH